VVSGTAAKLEAQRRLAEGAHGDMDGTGERTGGRRQPKVDFTVAST
jgi:hypothetical protein